MECPTNSISTTERERLKYATKDAKPKATIHGLSQSKDEYISPELRNFKKNGNQNHPLITGNKQLKEEIANRSLKIANLEKKLQYIEAASETRSTHTLGQQSNLVESTRFLRDFKHIEEKFKQLNIEAEKFNTNDLKFPHSNSFN
jgi:hypothetical protein